MTELADRQPTEAELAEEQIRAASDCTEYRKFGTREGDRYITEYGISSVSIGLKLRHVAKLYELGTSGEYGCSGYTDIVENL